MNGMGVDTGLRVMLRHQFEDGPALNVSFDAPMGVTALFGRSGAGKTSVVRAVAGLLHADKARIEVGGRVLSDTDAALHVPVHQRRVGYVFQEPRLFPHRDVRGNIRYGALRDLPEARLRNVTDMLGITDLLPRAPATLSGGEAQRVAIARALLSDPAVLLMDEPLASLDAGRKAQVLPFLERISAQAGVPILYVSHDMAEVARLADTLVVLDAGQVVAAGPAQDILSDPALVPHLGVQNAGAVLPGTLMQQDAGDGLSMVAVPGAHLLVPRVDAQTGAALRLRIPATDVMLATDKPKSLSALNILPAQVTAIEEGRGPGVMVRLSVGEAAILARITQRSAKAMALGPGSSVYAILKTVSVAPTAIGTAPLPARPDPLSLPQT